MAELKNKNVLVTGGAGFIGSHLCDEILKHNVNKLVALDNLWLGKESNMENAKKSPNFIFEKVDATDYKEIERVILSHEIDVIFHLAVIPLEASLEKPIWCFDENVKMTQNILEIIRLSGKKIPLIAYSSSEVYGSAVYTPMDEKHPLNSHTPYAASKAAADLLVYSYYETFGLEIVIVRPFNNYGPRQNEGSFAGVIPITLKKLMKGEKPVIFDDGQQTRDFIFVKETAYWTVEIFRNENTRGKILNLASGKQTSIERVIKAICKEMNYTGDFERRERRIGDVRVHQGDMSFAKELINFESKIEFEEGIISTVDWYKNNLKV
ncbi:MAG: GDP-mannose 4,6-dehydratase [Candidatus Sericytochromatia bacterium]